uniref:Uncharacterized protein n=1 Tax=Rhizophagus irregularis (strain DAOM 181602 / DAOM 197198 / MUCL 43194) TaxID=747089 RepID=U9SN53_RHIID
MTFLITSSLRQIHPKIPNIFYIVVLIITKYPMMKFNNSNDQVSFLHKQEPANAKVSATRIDVKLIYLQTHTQYKNVTYSKDAIWEHQFHNSENKHLIATLTIYVMTIKKILEIASFS